MYAFGVAGLLRWWVIKWLAISEVLSSNALESLLRSIASLFHEHQRTDNEPDNNTHTEEQSNGTRITNPGEADAGIDIGEDDRGRSEKAVTFHESAGYTVFLVQAVSDDTGSIRDQSEANNDQTNNLVGMSEIGRLITIVLAFCRLYFG